MLRSMTIKYTSCLVFVFLALAIMTPNNADAQMTERVGQDVASSEKALEQLSQLKDSSCRWKNGPKELSAENLSPEVANFARGGPYKVVKKYCEGTIRCEVQNSLWESDSYLVCGQVENNCNPRKCWMQYLNDRILFQKRPLQIAPAGSRPGMPVPASVDQNPSAGRE